MGTGGGGCGGHPRIPTCSHTICRGTIPLLSLLLGPFRSGRISRPQPAQLPLWGRPGRFLIFQGARLGVDHPPYPPPPLSSLPPCSWCLSSISSLLLLPPPRLYLSPSSTPPLPSPPLPVSPSRRHGHCFLSGRRGASLSSPLSTPAPELPIHLLRMPYSPTLSPGTRCNYNPRISKRSWYKRQRALSSTAPLPPAPNALFSLVFKRQKASFFCQDFFFFFSWGHLTPVFE